MKVGDTVSVVDDRMNGTVVSVSGKVVVIEDEHGFRYEYAREKLVPRDVEMYKRIKTIQKAETSKNISKKHDKNPFLLDLHFENLVKKTSGYTAAERLFLQKEKLRDTLDYCRQNNLKKLEIIHGIGDGVLQQMVYEVLESQTHLEFHNKEILHEQSGTVLVYFR